jgi:hypothetical protein
MTCTLTMKLVSESQRGNAGDDWKYELAVGVYNDDLLGEGIIRVPRHRLESGALREPFGSPEPVIVYSGDCQGQLKLKISLIATEIDLFVDDVGQLSQEIVLKCPIPGGSKVTREIDLALPVREMPRIVKRESIFTLRVRFTLASD